MAIESLSGSPCVVKTDIAKPKIYIGAKEITHSDKVKKGEDGAYIIDLKKRK